MFLLATTIARLARGPCPACDRPRSGPLCAACRRPSGVAEAAVEALLDGRALAVVGAYFEERRRPAPLGATLRAFKDRGDRYAGHCLARLFARSCLPFAAGAAVVVPVPPDRSRLAARGLNPATWIAAALAGRARLGLETGALRRCGDVPAQRGLSGDERRRNARHAFALGGADVRGYAVLLVDDVVTTGATLGAAAARLEAAGARSVRCAVLAAADEELAGRCRSRTSSAGSAAIGTPPA